MTPHTNTEKCCNQCRDFSVFTDPPYCKNSSCPCHTNTGDGIAPSWEKELFSLMNNGHFTIQQVTDFVKILVQREREEAWKDWFSRNDMFHDGVMTERKRILKLLPSRFTNSAEIMKRYEHGEVSQDWMNGYNANLKEIQTAIRDSLRSVLHTTTNDNGVPSPTEGIINTI